MSKLCYFNLHPTFLLPQDPGFGMKYRSKDIYYQTLGFVASLVRDNEAQCSIYIGDPYDDYIVEYLNELPPEYSLDFTDFLEDIKHRAENLSRLLPPGIFERIDVHDVHASGVVYLGILHDTDYR